MKLLTRTLSTAAFAGLSIMTTTVPVARQYAMADENAADTSATLVLSITSIPANDTVSVFCAVLSNGVVYKRVTNANKQEEIVWCRIDPDGLQRVRNHEDFRYWDRNPVGWTYYGSSTIQLDVAVDGGFATHRLCGTIEEGAAVGFPGCAGKRMLHSKLNSVLATLDAEIANAGDQSRFRSTVGERQQVCGLVSDASGYFLNEDTLEQ